VVALCAGPDRKVRRVLRGGAFNNNQRNVRCAYRNHNNTNNRNDNNGFRVVVVASHDFHAGRKCQVGQATQGVATLPGRGRERRRGPVLAAPWSEAQTAEDGWARAVGSQDTPSASQHVVDDRAALWLSDN